MREDRVEDRLWERPGPGGDQDELTQRIVGSRGRGDWGLGASCILQRKLGLGAFRVHFTSFGPTKGRHDDRSR